ncbi:XRE family transcriptional regulator [Actibacterium pelagium]|uniref:XRE family transcriptional regulator n=2 Tax=Actibacterium pelagium TaxID=2029103 RepID=A0A917EIP2_9RHOB|nr:XRE family transcriptional regulator [Actibacterium pelagium]
MRQAELARSVGISPSYLNLIEHNRRRIGGKLLVDIARQLEVETTALTEGAGATLIASLRDAASGNAEAEKEMPRIEEFVGRFPGWAQLLSSSHRRIDDLERTVEALTERMAHDPFLSESLHEILSTVTAIRSTAGILNDTQDIDREWRERFHRNMFEESQRLADGAEALVSYLDSAGGDADVRSSPQEEVVAFLKAREFHLPDLEEGDEAAVHDLVVGDEDLKSASAVELAEAFLHRYQSDAEKVPMSDLLEALKDGALNPSALARQFRVDLSTILRRLASVPRDKIGRSIGLVECDGSGTLTYRKEIEGFPLPRFGAACPLWPLYQALAQPMMPVHRVVSVSARSDEVFETYAVCQSINAEQFDEPQVYRAVMLFFPRKAGEASDALHLDAGTSCRICERRKCVARREPSILADGL